MTPRPDDRSWRGDTPVGPAAARERILDAARECLVRADGSTPSIGAVAQQAGVHRSTIYEYFSGKEELLVGVFAREARAVYAGVSSRFDDTDFLPGLAAAIADGITIVSRSEVMRHLLGPDGVGRLVSATSASTSWDAAIQSTLSRHLVGAIERGEVRDDVPLDELIRWVVRVALSVTAEPPRDPEWTLTQFLLPALRAR